MGIGDEMMKSMNGGVNSMKYIFFTMYCSYHSLADELTSMLICGGVVKVLYVYQGTQATTDKRAEMNTDVKTK